MSRLFIALTVTCLMTLPSAADDLRTAAEAVAGCRNLPESDKAACFDTTADALAKMLEAESAGPSPVDAAPAWAKAPEPEVTSVAKTAQVRGEKPKEAKQFTVTIVRVANAGGKLKFYTDDGQVWFQTQRDAVTLPALPSTAKIKRRLTGNPVIQFPNRSKSYKVERVE